MKAISKVIPNTIKNIPGSKSYIHRFLIASFVLNKKITLYNVNFCDDVKTTINCLKKLGAQYKLTSNSIKYLGNKLINHKVILNCKESGSTLRMLMPIASFLYSNVKFIGKESLFKRPLDIYEFTLKENKISFNKTKNSFEIYDKFPTNDYCIDSSISSQFVTGLLFLLLKTKTKIILRNEIVSKNYILITLKVLKQLGVKVSFKNNVLKIKSIKQINDNKFNIPCDMSGLSNFLVLGALNGKLTIKTNELDELQPDYAIISLLKSIGVNITFSNYRLFVKSKKIKPFNVNINNCIDLGPILFVLASQIKGESKIFGVKRLVFKESNRLNNMVAELNKLSVNIKINDDCVIINGCNQFYNNKKNIFSSYNDHRIAMALIVLSKLIKPKCFLTSKSCLNKSFPTFLKLFEK